MKRFTVMAVVAIGMAAMAVDASAQGYVRRTYPGGYNNGYNNGSFNNGGYNNGYRRVPVGPRYPVYIEEGNFDGFTPDGGINTSGVTVFNSVRDPYRNSSRFNGSMREVNRPLYDRNGRIVGYERGTEWINSATGRVHGERERITNNGLGGVNREEVAYGQEGE